MNDIDRIIEEKLQTVRDSFGPNKCQSINALTRELIIQAIDVKIKELVLSHDFRGRYIRKGSEENKESPEGDIRIYDELKKQIKALPPHPIDNTPVGE